MRFQLTILGCNAALPSNGRHPSSQVLNIHEKLYLIDCGEGTQIRMNRFAIRKNKINQVFISHLHGDHVFGLAGFLTSLSLEGRSTPIEIFGPPGIRKLIEIQLEISQSHLSYSLHFREIETERQTLIYENDNVEVLSFPLRHRIPAYGYLFREKALPLNIDPDKIKQYDIPFSAIPAIKAGKDHQLPSGKRIPNWELTFAPKRSRSFAYCSDTAYWEGIIPIIADVDLLYHEATFANDKKEQAKLTLHSTAVEAATIAVKAKVGQLIIGHYSSRYKDISILLEEALSIFENTIPAIEGKTYDLPLQRADR